MQACTNEDLLRAALENRASTVRRLLRAGADPRFRNNLPLSVASKMGHVDVVRELLAHGANPSHRSGAAGSALHWSCAEGRIDVVKLMLSKGADPNSIAESGQSPLHWACERSHAPVVRALLDAHANPNIVDNRRLTPLHSACRQGMEEIVEMLISGGANCNMASSSEQTPLHWACAAGSEGCIRLLLQHGASVTHADLRGRTPLHYACEHGRSGAVALLLKTPGVSPLCVDKLRSSPLHAAAFEGHPDVVSLLIKAGADVNGVGTDSMTPLVLCAMSSRPDSAPAVARLLLAAGANPNARNQRNRTALAMAISSSRVGLVRALLDGGADPNEGCNFSSIVRCNNLELASVLLQGGMNPDYDDSGSLPLFVACTELYPDMVALLLRNGADPEKRGKQGFTPLGVLISLAAVPRSSYCRPPFLSVVATLLQAGASLEEAYSPAYRDEYDAELCLQGIVKEISRKYRLHIPKQQMMQHLITTHACKTPMTKLA